MENSTTVLPASTIRVGYGRLPHTQTYCVWNDHVYNVTVMYTSKDGEVNESGFSNDASTSATSVNSVEETPSSYDITNINGVRVRTGAKDKNGLKRGVYIINGKKCVVK